MFNFLNEIEKKEAKVAILELLKIAIFIGFIPSFIAILVDLGLFNSVTESKELKSFDALMGTLIPNNSIYMNLMAFYTIFHMVLTYILGICVHLKRKISPKFLALCEFFSPIAEVLYQLLAVISGVFFTIGLLFLFSTEPSTSFVFFIIFLFLMVLSISALTINRTITHHYRNL